MIPLSVQKLEFVFHIMTLNAVGGNVPNDRIERSVHPFHIVIRDFDPKLVFDLVEKFSQVRGERRCVS